MLEISGNLFAWMKRSNLWLLILLTLAGIALAVVVLRPKRDGAKPPTVARQEQSPARPARKGNIWARPSLAVPQDAAKREQRLRSESFFMDIANEANEATWNAMQTSDDERARLRQSFAEYRTGCMRIIEHPSEFPSSADSNDPNLPWNIYERQLKGVLGNERYESFVAQYRVERRARQSSRKAAYISGFGRETARE